MRYNGSKLGSLNTFFLQEKKQREIEWTPIAVKDPMLQTKPLLLAANARLIWAQEAGSTREAQRRHQAELYSVHMCANLRVLSLRASGLLQTRCISYGPQIGQGEQQKTAHTTMLLHLLINLWTWDVMAPMDKTRQGPPPQSMLLRLLMSSPGHHPKDQAHIERRVTRDVTSEISWQQRDSYWTL